MAIPLAQPDDLSAFMQRDVPENTARFALDTVSGAMRTHCGWNLSRQTLTDEPVERRSRRSLFLPTLWLVSVESLQLGGSTLVSGVDFDWARNGTVIIGSSWGSSGIARVSYTHGYDVDHPRMDMLRGITVSAASRMVDNPMSYGNWSVGNESYGVRGNAADVSAILAGSEREQLEPLMLPVVLG